jgi:hypothetical protein
VGCAATSVHYACEELKECLPKQLAKAAGVEFIDDNGGGRGVRLRKGKEV